MTKPKDPSEYLKRGAPEFPYDVYLAERICEAVATSTDSLKKIIEQNPGFPSEKVIRKWRYKIPTFGNMFTQAKRVQAELYVEECIDIADDSGGDAIINEKGMPIVDGEAINRARLRVDTRKWIGCKLVPRIYGDKVQIQDVDAETRKAAKEIKEYVAELNERLKEYEQPY